MSAPTNDDDTCICHPLHGRSHHEAVHRHGPAYTEDCNDGCCVVDACDCVEFRSVADAAERQWEHNQRALANG